MKIRRYMSVDSFLRTVNDRELFLGSIKNHEDSDINEGRVTDHFLRTQKYSAREDILSDLFSDLPDDANFKEVYESNLEKIDQELRADLLRTVVARDHVYIQCWTKTLECQPLLWQGFGDSCFGVSIISNVKKVNEIINGHTAGYGNEHYLPFDGPVSYNREDLKPESLSFLNGDEFLSPCFALSGNPEKNFMHEKEYRFLIKDQETFHEDWMYSYDDTQEVSGSFLDAFLERRAQANTGKTGMTVGYYEYDFINEVILGASICKSDERKIRKFCKKHKISIRKSNIACSRFRLKCLFGGVYCWFKNLLSK